MSPLSMSFIVFACVFGGALLGLFLHVPLDPDTKETVRLAMALVSTMVAMVLGLLVGSAKGFFDTQNSEVAQLAAISVTLDRTLAHYGPAAKDVRKALRTATMDFDTVTLSRDEQGSSVASDFRGEDLYESIQALSPENDSQRSLKSQASNLALQAGQIRWLMFEQRAVPTPSILFGVLLSWLVALFVSYGVFAKPTATITAGLFVSALAVSGAILLIAEMYQPYGGLIRVSNEPIRAALTQLGR